MPVWSSHAGLECPGQLLCTVERNDLPLLLIAGENNACTSCQLCFIPGV